MPVATVDETAPFIAEFLDMVQGKQHAVIIFGLTVKTEVCFTVRGFCQIAFGNTAGTEPALASIYLPVIITAENISHTFSVLMI